MYYQRTLDLKFLLAKKSHFLFGPRQTGKTALIHHALKKVQIFDLLDEDVYEKLLRRPRQLGEEITSRNRWVVIDEIQRIPSLLNEVHRLIETRRIHFLLTGSSARKLRRGGANLLGGRAWNAELFPLTTAEIPDFSLIRYLNTGGLPSVYLSKNPGEELKNYVRLYLKEEIQAEALVRKLDHFVRFLDTLGLVGGQELNYQSISNDAGVPQRTVAAYIEVLKDTLMGFELTPYLKSKKRKAITRSKFFFFDVGVANALAQRGEIRDRSELFGKCFEHFILQEIRAYLSYRRKESPLQYWRSTSGFEVDCVVGNDLALEIKSTTHSNESHIKGLKALREEGLVKQFFLVTQDSEERTMEKIRVLPWKKFLKELWSGRIDIV